MKKLLVLAILLPAFLALSGCAKKQEQEELQPITMESLSTPTNATVPAVTDTKITPPQESSLKEIAPLPPLPPQGPYKPNNTDIQTALKNAGFYKGKIDGTIGPKSKKAIEEFQSANGLKADGKVGPKTWEALGRYLNAAPEQTKR